MASARALSTGPTQSAPAHPRPSGGLAQRRRAGDRHAGARELVGCSHRGSVARRHGRMEPYRHALPKGVHESCRSVPRARDIRLASGLAPSVPPVSEPTPALGGAGTADAGPALRGAPPGRPVGSITVTSRRWDRLRSAASLGHWALAATPDMPRFPDARSHPVSSRLTSCGSRQAIDGRVYPSRVEDRSVALGASARSPAAAPGETASERVPHGLGGTAPPDPVRPSCHSTHRRGPLPDGAERIRPTDAWRTPEIRSGRRRVVPPRRRRQAPPDGVGRQRPPLCRTIGVRPVENGRLATRQATRASLRGRGRPDAWGQPVATPIDTPRGAARGGACRTLSKLPGTAHDLPDGPRQRAAAGRQAPQRALEVRTSGGGGRSDALAVPLLMEDGPGARHVLLAAASPRSPQAILWKAVTAPRGPAS